MCHSELVGINKGMPFASVTARAGGADYCLGGAGRAKGATDEGHAGPIAGGEKGRGEMNWW